MPTESQRKARTVHALSPITMSVDSYRAVITCRCGHRFVAYGSSSIVAGEHVTREATAHLNSAGTGHFLNVTGKGEYRLVSP